jgi:CubicO group peptidase (beta-lactamase class C family)
MMLRSRLAFWVIASSVAAATAAAQEASEPPAREETPQAPGQATPSQPEPSAEQIELARLIQRVRDRLNMPAIGAAVVQADGSVTTAVIGVRQLGMPEVVRLEDPWHLGSCGKAMTATMIAMLVEEGVIGWETTIAEALPSMAALMHESYRNVTLEQLLTGRGGVPASFPAKLWDDLMAFGGSAMEGRELLARGILSQPPEVAPGTAYIYSNPSWVIAGLMAEHAAKRPFETLMRQKLFDPLGMKTAGFGAPGNGGPLPTEARGHTSERIPVEPGPRADNPPALAPAGTVHCSMEDWAKFIALQLRGVAGTDETLSRESWAKLLNPPEPPPVQDAAMGWVIKAREWAGGVAMTHDGSNTMWHSVAWMAPRKGFAVLVATNIGGSQYGLGINQAAWDIIQRHLQKTEGREPTPSGR